MLSPRELLTAPQKGQQAAAAFVMAVVISVLILGVVILGTLVLLPGRVHHQVELDKAFWTNWANAPLTTFEALRLEGPHLFSLTCQLDSLRGGLADAEFSVRMLEHNADGSLSLNSIYGYADRETPEGKRLLATLADGKQHLVRVVVEHEHPEKFRRVRILHSWNLDQAEAEVKKAQELDDRRS